MKDKKINGFTLIEPALAQRSSHANIQLEKELGQNKNGQAAQIPGCPL
ncbi:MAG: hypothetical protein ABI863_21230 [Ginsengibacter sp.]